MRYYLPYFGILKFSECTQIQNVAVLIFKNMVNQLTHRYFPSQSFGFGIRGLNHFKAAYGHGWDSEGQFSMEVLDLANAGDMGGGRRNVKALMNPNKKDNWAGMSTDEGLIEMAIAYR